MKGDTTITSTPRVASQSEATLLAARGRRRHPVQLEVLSLDVFDTVLVRSCGAPESLYLWLGRRLQRKGFLACGPEMFARARHRVETDVWRREGGADAPVTLAHFYDELARVLPFEASLVDRLVAEELQLESEVLRPTRQTADLLELGRSVGLRIVFTSDMYLPASFIRQQLEAHRLWRRGARCFSSTDQGASKSTGALFGIVAEALGVHRSSILHVGDNYDCDVRAADEVGVAARWLPEGRLNRYERLLTDHRWETGGLAAALAGASRLARMNAPAYDQRARAIRDVAAGVAGPALVAYVLWVLNRARTRGLERLYFVSRDGQVLAELASMLVRRLGWEIEIRYLFASRRTVNPSVAAVSDARPADLHWAFRNRDDVTVAHLLGRLDLDLSEAAPDLAAAGISQATASTRLTQEIRAALEAAVTSGRLRDLAVARARARHVLASDYLRQEGLLDEGRFGIVDLGGVGSQMGALHQLCIRAGGEPPHLFLLGLDRHPDPRQAALIREPPWLEDVECYLFDEPRGKGILPPPGLVTSLQMFCAADHATVVAYERRDDGRVEPVLAFDAGDVGWWGLPVVRATLHEFVRSLVLGDDLVDLRANLRSAVSDVVREFWTNPTPQEGKAWGVFPFEGGELTRPLVKPLAEPYTWSRLAREIADGSFPHHAWNHWHEGAVARSSPGLRALIVGAKRIFRRMQGSRSLAARASLSVAGSLRKR